MRHLHVLVIFLQWCKGSVRTLVGVLSCEFGDCVSHLAPHRVVRLLGEALQQLGAYGLALGGVEGQEEVQGLACGRLARFGGRSPEDDGGECACL
jgi:hypothetical protein